MGVPCVVTRAGDAAAIVGSSNFVVPVRNAKALAEALLRLCALSRADRAKMGKEGAQKVRNDYGIHEVRRRYEEVYLEALTT